MCAELHVYERKFEFPVVAVRFHGPGQIAGVYVVLAAGALALALVEDHAGDAVADERMEKRVVEAALGHRGARVEAQAPGQFRRHEFVER